VTPEYLTTREFDKWCGEDATRNGQLNDKLDRLLDGQDSQSRMNIDVAARIAALEALKPATRIDALEQNQEHAGKLSARLSGVISVATSALINGVLIALGGKA